MNLTHVCTPKKEKSLSARTTLSLPYRLLAYISNMTRTVKMLPPRPRLPGVSHLRTFWREHFGSKDMSRFFQVSRDSPPPYQKLKNGKKQSNNPASSPKTILATDVPQWLWSNLQCRQWLLAVLVTYMNIEPTAAATSADRFEGYGPNIYIRDLQAWNDLLGDHNGAGIYMMLLSVRHHKGAIPRKVTITHGMYNVYK